MTEYNAHIKFLAVIFQHNKNWGEYIEECTNLDNKGINLMKILSNQNWGVKVKLVPS